MVPIPFVIPRHVAYTNPLENGGFNFTVIFDGVRESAGPQGSTSSWSSDREIDVRLSLSFRAPCGLVPVQVLHSPLLGSRFSLTSGARSCVSFHAQACPGPPTQVHLLEPTSHFRTCERVSATNTMPGTIQISWRRPRIDRLSPAK